MTTYNTYQEAKIANPESEIYIDELGLFRCGRDTTLATKKCNPADHCMTVEKFLKAGHEFADGDVILDEGHPFTVKVNPPSTGLYYTLESSNKPEIDDDTRYILRAAALEGKPKRVNVEYEPVNTGDEIITYRNDIFFKHDSGNYVSIENHTLRSVLNHMDNDNLYRRIETEVTERDEFIEAMSAILPEFDKRTIPSWIGRIYDSGKFKLVEGE